MSFGPGFSANFLAGKLCGFLSVKIKLLRLGSALKYGAFGRDSHSAGVKPPKMFPSVSSINVSVFAWPLQRP
jgi:hypothetical protein